jgi:hypothetical protein
MGDIENLLVRFRDTLNKFISLKHSNNIEEIRKVDFSSLRANLQDVFSELNRYTAGHKLELELVHTTTSYTEKLITYIEYRSSGQPVDKIDADLAKISSVFKEVFKNYVMLIRTVNPADVAPRQAQPAKGEIKTTVWQKGSASNKSQPATEPKSTPTPSPVQEHKPTPTKAAQEPEPVKVGEQRSVHSDTHTSDLNKSAGQPAPAARTATAPASSQDTGGPPGETEAEKRKRMIEEKKKQILQKKLEEQQKADAEKEKLADWEKSMADAVRSRVRKPIDENQRKDLMLKYMKEWEIQSTQIKWDSELVRYETKRRTLTSQNGRVVIAKGGFGVIYLVEYGSTLAAMKILDANSAQEKEAVSEFEQELELLTRLRHPNILLYLGGSTSNNDFFFLTELMETDLFELIKKKDPRSEWNNQGKYFARDIASALSYLHGKQLVHKDMKSGNVLIHRSVAKLADFGLTKTVEEKNNRLTIDRAFSASWASPEQINPNSVVSYPTDVYSFAIVCWEMLTQKTPWESISTFQLITATAGGEFKKWHPLPKTTPPPIDLLLTKCWFAEPEKRPTSYNCLVICESAL